VRSPEKETVRLQRIQHEFVRGFRGHYDLGPAVTVFGSADLRSTTLGTNLLARSGRNWQELALPH
jgi:hypothetical protein